MQLMLSIFIGFYKARGKGSIVNTFAQATVLFAQRRFNKDAT